MKKQVGVKKLILKFINIETKTKIRFNSCVTYERKHLSIFKTYSK